MENNNRFPLYGFTLLRNGQKYDYPYLECLQALSSLCQETYLALGDNEDNTEETLSVIQNLHIIPTVWDMTKMGNGGQLLSEQTNIALKELRNQKAIEQNAWGFYLQTDELIHEDDIEQIRKDIEFAEANGFDAISFRYYHFWLNHNQFAISKRWYPQEIRAVKLSKDIWSHGDAQGFKGQEKVFESDVHIFHYGHVREEDKREAKQELLIKLIRPSEKYKKYKSREEKAFKNTETLPYYGPHPKWMKERIERFQDIFQMEPKELVKIYDPENILSDEFKKKILTDELIISKTAGPDCLTLSPTFLEKLGFGPKIPLSMRSPIARNWNDQQRFRLLLWSKGISTL